MLPIEARRLFLFHFQCSNNHLKAVQLDALKGFHAFLQASQKALKNLNGCQLARWHNHGRLSLAYCSGESRR